MTPDPFANFVNTFTSYVDAVGKLHLEPKPPKIDLSEWELGTEFRASRAESRLLALENRLGEVHKLVDKQEQRLDAQLGRIMELELVEQARQASKDFVFDPHERETP